MSRFLLIRHGDKQQIVGDPPLSELGLQQAKKTGEHLKSLAIKAIYSGPLLRTKQTAEIIANFFDLPIVEDDRLKERMNWGDIPNQSFEEFVELWNKTSYERDFVPPVGDSSINKGKKITELINEIKTKYSEGNFILVSHGGAISDFLINNFTESDLAKFHDLILVKRSGAIKECSITIVDFDGNNFSLDSIAALNHLT